MKRSAFLVLCLGLGCLLAACDEKQDTVDTHDTILSETKTLETKKVVKDQSTDFDNDPHQINKDIYANMLAFQKMVEQYHFKNENYPPNFTALYNDAQTNKYFTSLQNPINLNIQWNEKNKQAEGVAAISSPEGTCQNSSDPNTMYPVAAGTLRYWVTANGYAIRACGAEEDSGFLSKNKIQVILAGGDMAIEEQDQPQTKTASVTAQTLGVTPQQWTKVQSIPGNLWLPQPTKLGYVLSQFNFENSKGGGPGSGISLDITYAHPVTKNDLFFSCMSSGVGSLPSDGPGKTIELPGIGKIEVFPSFGGTAAYTQYNIENGGVDCYLSSGSGDSRILIEALKTLSL